MYTSFSTNFLVLPKHANNHSPLIFGGAFFSEMDLCAANTANRALYDSEAHYAVTHKANVVWHKPCYVGDLIFLEGNITDLRNKAISVEVTAWREKPHDPYRDFVGEGRFVFVSVDNGTLQDKPDFLPYMNHGLKNGLDELTSQAQEWGMY